MFFGTTDKVSVQTYSVVAPINVISPFSIYGTKQNKINNSNNK